MRHIDVDDLRERMEALYEGVGERSALRQALTAMVYVHPCNCGQGIPDGACARCRAVVVLGFDPAIPVVASTFETILKETFRP